jgi:chemotaxis signal transduction protein
MEGSETPHASGPAWLVFRIGQAECALPLDAVSEIVMPGPLHLIPRVPLRLGGMLNTRGEPLVAVDGGLAIGSTAGAGQRHVLVLDAGGAQIGVMVDAVLRIERDLDVHADRAAERDRGSPPRLGPPRGAVAGRDAVTCVEWKRRRDDTPLGVVDAAALVRRATDLLCEHRAGNKEESCHDAF